MTTSKYSSVRIQTLHEQHQMGFSAITNCRQLDCTNWVKCRPSPVN